MLQMPHLFDLVCVHAHVLAMSIICVRGPTTRLRVVDPVLHRLDGATLRRLSSLLPLHHVVHLASLRVRIKLPVHVLGAVPVLLSAARQRLSSIYSHDVTCDLFGVL